MSFALKFNKGKKFNIDTEGFEFVDRGELFDKDGEGMVYPLTAIFINKKSKYGDHPVFATNKFFVDAPGHMMETVNDILADADAISCINEGKVGFTLYEYTTIGYDDSFIGIRFVDVE